MHAVAGENGPTADRFIRPMAVPVVVCMVTKIVVVMGFMAMSRRTMVMLVAVVPELRFVQEKEKNQTDEQHHEQVMGTGLALERFRE
jgi:ammonia channel protein AmtB